MDPTLPDHRAITVPVPTADIIAEVQNQGLEAAAISHFVVQYDPEIRYAECKHANV